MGLEAIDGGDPCSTARAEKADAVRPASRTLWTGRLFPPAAPPAGEPFAWLRFLHPAIAAAGLLAVDAGAWRLYTVVLLLLVVEWPFHIQLTEGVEIYLPALWTGAAAAYVLGSPVLPVFWASTVLGFGLIIVLDTAGLVRATGITAETLRQVRGEPFPPGAGVDGNLRGFVHMSTQAVRVGVLAALRTFAPRLPLPVVVLLGESAVSAWLSVAPVPGRMAPRRAWARFAATLGLDMLVATELLQVLMVCFLLLAYQRAGAVGFVGASLSTLVLHAILKRLNDTRVESERRRQDLVAMREALDRRQRLAAIGETASTVFHQVARHHGAIGMFAHLLSRGPAEADTGADWTATARAYAGRIATSVEHANRVIDELLRFSQDRALNLYPQSLAALIEECVAECRPRAEARGVRLEVAATPDATLLLDKHKVRQALANVLDNAIEATAAGGRVELGVALDGARAGIAVRDFGSGIAAEVRDRLFTPFVTTKADGIGLGLVLAKELLEAHGGGIAWAPADPGTTFLLTLPRPPG